MLVTLSEAAHHLVDPVGRNDGIQLLPERDTGCSVVLCVDPVDEGLMHHSPHPEFTRRLTRPDRPAAQFRRRLSQSADYAMWGMDEPRSPPPCVGRRRVAEPPRLLRPTQ